MDIVCNPIFSTREYPSQEDNISCFVIMPFTGDMIQEIYTEYIKPSVEEFGIKCLRGDDIFSVSAIMEDIFGAICKANIIIAEFTGKNPNVLYEAGIAHTIGKPLIGITQNIEDVPFDLRNIRQIVYKTTPKGLKQLKETLKNTLSTVMDQHNEMYPQVFLDKGEEYKKLADAYIRKTAETDNMYSLIEERILKKFEIYNKKIRSLCLANGNHISFKETGINFMRIDGMEVDVDYFDEDREEIVNIARECVGEFYISQSPITNFQYKIFVDNTGHPCPDYWENETFPYGQGDCPVIGVSWVDIMMFCKWLTELFGYEVDIPSEAQWLAAAGYGIRKRRYPWGENWLDNACNSKELNLVKNKITNVNYFSKNKSPYGCIDMLGNVWEWTKSPYEFDRKNGFKWRAVRGGANYTELKGVGVLARLVAHPGHFLFVRDLGFRVITNGHI